MAISSFSRRAGALVASFACSLVGCTDLDDIELGICGNQVLDPGEDCDDSSIACGAPNTPRACYYVCSFESGATECPSGYVCGANDTCAKAADDFASPIELELGGNAALTADFDTNRVGELVVANDGSRRLSTLFFSPSFTVIGEETLPIDSEVMAVGQLGFDSSPDLLIASDAALLSLSSLQHANGADRSLVGTAYTAFTFPGFLGRGAAMPSRVVDPPAGQVDVLQADASVEALLLTVDAQSDAPFSGVFVRDPYTGGTPLVTLLPAPISSMEALAGIVRAPLVPRPTGDACDELVIVRSDTLANAIHVVLSCDEAGQSVISSPVCMAGSDCLATLTAEEQIQSAHRVELDGDPEAEVLLIYGAPDGPPTGLGVLEWQSPYSFAVTTPTSAEGRDWLTALHAVQGIAPAAVLLAADLNGDGAPDFVRSDGVYLSDRNHPFDGLTPSYYRAGIPSSIWAEVTIGDFDGNGLPDVVGCGRGFDSDLDVLVNVGLAYFNPRSLPGRGRCGTLTVGDFDGDGAHDLVVRERPLAAEGSGLPAIPCDLPDDLVVRFGGPSVGLGERRVIARVAGIEHLTTGRLARLDKRDSIDDFGLISRCSSESSTGAVDLRAAVLHGASNRQIAAPYVLVDTFEEIDPHPDALVPYTPKHFALSHRAPIAVALGERPPVFAPPGAALRDWILFVLRDAGDVAFGEQHLIPIDVEASHGEISTADSRVAIGKLTSAKREAVVLVDPEHIHVVADYTAFPNKTELVTGDLLSMVQTFELGLPFARVEAAIAYDTDADGQDELFVGGTAEGGPFLRRYTSLDGAAPTFQDIPVLQGVSVLDLAFLPREDGTGRADVVAAIGGLGAAIYRLDGDVLLPHAFSISTAMSDIEAVACGDLNGDQLTDLILVGAARTRIYPHALRRAGDIGEQGNSR